MGLLVFDKNEVLQTVLSNDGSACPYYGAIHDEKINLENTLTFLIPADHTDAQYVTEGSLVAFKDLDSNWQLFEVKRIVDTDDTATIKQAFCDHAFYELLGDIVPSGGGAGTSAWLAVTSALSQSRWEVGNVVNLGIQTTVFSYQTALACLQQIAANWKGELQFRIDISNNIITHRYVDLVDQRGNTTGKQFVFGKDLLKIEREVDFTGLYTAMYGRGQATTEGVRLNFASINGGKEYAEDVAALAQYGIKGIKHRFGVFDDSQEADPARLLTKTQAALQIAKVPVVSYQFDAVSLEQLSPGYDHEAVRIGDVVVAIDNNFEPPLQLFVRVIQIQRNHLEFDKTKIVLGNFRQDLASNQAFQNRVNQQVQNNAGIWDNAAALVPSVLDPAIYDLTSELRSAGGYVVFSANDGIMVYDTPDPATATKAMKLGAGIFGIADSKIPDGSWNFRTFGDGAGFTADLITSGKIKADFLQIGPGTTFDPGYNPSTANATANAANTAASNALAAANAANTTANTANTAAGAAQTQANTANGTANSALANAATAQTQATLGVTNAWNAQQLLDQIGSDSSLTPVEKKTTQKEWTDIQGELPINDALAVSFGITTEKTNYDNAYNSLNTYITPLLANLTTVSSIVGMTLRNTFFTYYTNRRYLLNAISTKAKSTADTAVVNAASAQTQANTALTTATSAIARTHWSDVSQNKATTVTGGTFAANGPTFYAGNWTCTAVGQAIIIDLGSLMPQIVEIGIDSWYPSDITKIPKNFTIDYSPDSATWTNTQTVASNAIAPYVLSTMVSTFSARYIRLTVSAFQASQTTSTIGKFWISSLQGAELTFAQNLVGAIQTATNALQISTTMYADGSGMWLVGAGGLNVVKITSGGIAVGTAGTGGAFTTAITGTGIVATAITSGTIDASKMTVINLNAGSITAGTMAADRISGGTLTGVVVNATSVLSVSSNVWNAGTSNGITFGGVITGYEAPCTIKYAQGMPGNGDSHLTFNLDQGVTFEVFAPMGVDLYAPTWIGGTLTVTGDIQLGSTSSIRNTVPVKLLNGGAALGLNAGQLLASNDYLDVSKVPANGVYAKGGYANLGVRGGYTWTGSISLNNYVDIYHYLGYYPIAVVDGTQGNIILTLRSLSTSVLRLNTYSSGGGTFTGSVRIW